MNLQEYLQNSVNDDSLNHFVSGIVTSFVELKLKKNDIFVKEGKICQYFCFIESGILQHSIEVSSEEKTTYLCLKNSCTSALKKFSTPNSHQEKTLKH